MTIYITLEQALATHRSTIEHSGGGDCSDINIGYLESALEMVQNDDYYPSFKDKLVHLVWSVNRNHSFSDGNKRLSITIGVLFLSLNAICIVSSDSFRRWRISAIILLLEELKRSCWTN